MLNKFFSKLAPRERTALTAAVLIISVMLLDRIILGPIISKIRMLNEKIEEKKNRLINNTRILSNKERISKELEMYGKYSFKALPSEDELADLLGEIENLSAASEVYLIDSAPAGTKSEGIFKKYLVKIDCEGTMSQILSFMHEIESSRKILKLENARIRPKEKNSEIMNCSFLASKTVILE
ncbi:MAG: type 4a pilus biogenesis protein PilO [Candidatus Omnitrophota bacterium]